MVKGMENGKKTVLSLLLLGSLSCAATAPASEPVITGRFVLLGNAPTPEPLPPGRDACCQAAAPVDQRLVVGPGGGVANVVVSIEPLWGEPRAGLDQPAPDEPVVLTNLGCAFEPRVVIVRVGQPLVLANDDPTMHNVEARLTGPDRFNLVLKPEGRREMRLQEPHRKPLPVGCNVHPFMRAWLFVREEPHAAVSGPDGRFSLPAPPPGSWRLQFWHEGEYLAGLSVGQGATDRRGAVRLETAEDSTDLGEITLSAEILTPTRQ